MRSRADTAPVTVGTETVGVERVLRVAGAMLHVVGIASMALLLWRLLATSTPVRVVAAVGSNGALDTPFPALLRSAADTMDIAINGVPDVRTRAMLRALRGSGHTLRLSAPRALPPLAIAVEDEWKAIGSSRLQVVANDSAVASVADDAGLLDSMRLTTTGAHAASGPVQGVLRVADAASHASVASLRAGAPSSARVLVLGDATWESRFLISALEEDGWPVDAAVSLSPKVTVSQGTTRSPSTARHAIVVLLPGASSSAVSTLPQFVRAGGGLVIVGEAARLGGLGALRVGTPGATIAGELGAEASEEPRHGLDLVPMMSVSTAAVVLERRDGMTAVAARRLGAGRVVQVGYDNSWLWRMAGDDASPAAHRRWWTTLLSSIVPMRAPRATIALDAEHDTLDAAPLASLVRDFGSPVVRPAAVIPVNQLSIAAIDPRWILALAVVSLVASWVIRRWRGFT